MNEAHLDPVTVGTAAAAPGTTATAAPPTPPLTMGYEIAYFLVLLFLIVYTLPLYLMLYFVLSTNMFEGRPSLSALEVFASMIASGDNSFAIFHRVLLPLISGISVVAFQDRATSTRSKFLVIFLLVSILLSMGLNWVFLTPSVSLNLETLTIDGSPIMDAKLAAMFFNKVQETLGIYLLILLGLIAAESFRPRNET